jgi:phenylacetate-CoA ligase
MRRLVRIFGRNDNMVKLRGVNVFPEAVGAVVAADGRTNGEFFCFVDRVGEAGADQMDVWVELADPGSDTALVQTDLERRMKEVLGVKVKVTPVGRGALDQYTGTSQSSKVKRLLDRRRA